MRRFALGLLLAMLAGCASPVVVENPQTGERVTCATPLSEWNPWSQGDACAAGHIAQGWRIVR